MIYKGGLEGLYYGGIESSYYNASIPLGGWIILIKNHKFKNFTRCIVTLKQIYLDIC